MNKKYNIIINFILALILLIVAIVCQIFLHPNVSSFIVSILLGISTGILVADISLLIENNERVKELTDEFERVTCKILKNIYDIVNIDLGKEYVNIVKNQRIKIINDFQIIDNLLEQFNTHLVFKEKKIKKILRILFNLRIFIEQNCYFPNKTTQKILQDGERFIEFECLKMIKYCKQFNPQPIFSLLYNSRNNEVNRIKDFDNSLFGIIFSEEMKELNSKENKDLINELFLGLEKDYSNSDVNKTKEEAQTMQSKDWCWETYTPKRNDKMINKINDDK